MGTIGWYQSALTTHATYSANNGGTLSSYSDSYGYDANGALLSISVGGTHAHSVSLTNDVSGMMIRRDESDSSTLGEPHEVSYRFNGREMGASGNNGSDDEYTYQNSITDRTWYYQQGTGAFRNGGTVGYGSADFGLGIDPFTSESHGGVGGSYTVQAGDTLSTIAQDDRRWRSRDGN